MLIHSKHGTYVNLSCENYSYWTVNNDLKNGNLGCGFTCFNMNPDPTLHCDGSGLGSQTLFKKLGVNQKSFFYILKLSPNFFRNKGR